MKIEFHKERGTRKLQNRRRLVRVLQMAQKQAGLDEVPGILNVIFATRETVTALNESYVHHTGVTDVITFDLREEHSLLCNDRVENPGEILEDECMGEIYVCADIAAEWARKYAEFSPSKELVLYMVHGMLHLAGEDDLTDEARPKMRAAEARVLAALEQVCSLEGFLV